MTDFSVKEASALLGVSDDTVRRWADAGRLTLTPGANGRSIISGKQLAAVAEQLASESSRLDTFGSQSASARNRLTGIVTRVVKDTVMAQVDIQAGPFRLVALISREAADALKLEPGSIATATIKATNVGVEVP